MISTTEVHYETDLGKVSIRRGGPTSWTLIMQMRADHEAECRNWRESEARTFKSRWTLFVDLVAHEIGRGLNDSELQMIFCDMSQMEGVPRESR